MYWHCRAFVSWAWVPGEEYTLSRDPAWKWWPLGWAGAVCGRCSHLDDGRKSSSCCSQCWACPYGCVLVSYMSFAFPDTLGPCSCCQPCKQINNTWKLNVLAGKAKPSAGQAVWAETSLYFPSEPTALMLYTAWQEHLGWGQSLLHLKMQQAPYATWCLEAYFLWKIPIPWKTGFSSKLQIALGKQLHKVWKNCFIIPLHLI